MDDLKDPRRFLQLSQGVVKDRNGSALARGFILKTDHYASGRALDLDFNLQGAPNFRPTLLNVYGTAQPKLNGLRTILSILSCFPHAASPQKSVWISTREETQVYIGGRPFVLRDSERPFQSLALSDRGPQLEEIEDRLKKDVLREGKRYGGVVLVHEELSNGSIISTWVAADEVKTPKELFEMVQSEGYLVDYHRIPIGPEGDPENNYLDAYLQLIRQTDQKEAIIFNDGMGVVRTTFAMAAALIVRRKQIIMSGGKDPFMPTDVDKKRSGSDMDPHTLRALEEAKEAQARNKSMLLLMHILNKNLAFKNENGLIQVLTSSPKILDDLMRAVNGKYDVILQLVACLETGTASKGLVDRIIDSVDDVINLRHHILELRTMLTSAAHSGQEQKRDLQARGLKALERYFFLISFAAFVEQGTEDSKDSFGKWIHQREELWNMIQRLRHSEKNLRYFAPAQDLSLLSKAEAGQVTSSSAVGHERYSTTLNSGAELAGDEWASMIASNRSGITLRPGTILKRDIWPQEQLNQSESQQRHQIRGAINFRRVPDSNVFALSQPSEAGIAGVLAEIRQDFPGATWLNLREEPLCYINSYCYVLREQNASLRNLRNFAGISSLRLELLEERLKEDILDEIKRFGGKLLLHVEQDDGSVVPVWEYVNPQDVKTLREAMEEHTSDTFRFVRVPITAERSPDVNDFLDLIEFVRQHEAHHKNEAIIVNCQLGAGRSTMSEIIILLTQNWLRSGSRYNFLRRDGAKPYSFTIINNLLRIARNGPGVKATVDHCIERCNEQVDLTDTILQLRAEVDSAPPDKQRQLVSKALLHLKRFWWLLLLAIYFSSESPDSGVSFKQFIEARPVFKTLEQEFHNAGKNTITPLGALQSNHAQEDDMERTVASRKGRILSAQTILKSDFFSGLQKKSLPDQIEGAPNYRRIDPAAYSASRISIYGVGMPTIDGMKRALDEMGADKAKGSCIVWTSMREEPVLYVGGRPHVLRQVTNPFENIVTTGVTALTVEKIESYLKRDVIAEIEANGGQILLHDEIENPNGDYEVTGEFVTISPSEVFTPAEVFDSFKDQHLLDYQRLPVTDEQAPLPGVFAALEERVMNAVGAKHPELGLSFNCQMGRGRTTTAMIAAALTVKILAPESNVPDKIELVKTPTEEKAISGFTWDTEHENVYLKGEYKAILQLVGLLSHGKNAKKVADQAIDAMDQVQNLRKAIYDYKLRFEAAETGSGKQKRIAIVGLNYLFRYGLLIAFADYLIGRVQDRHFYTQQQPYQSKFLAYMNTHKEIERLLSRTGFD